MCPLWPFHFIIIYLVLFCTIFYIAAYASTDQSKWSVNVLFDPSTTLNVKMFNTKRVNFTLNRSDHSNRDGIPSPCLSDMLQLNVRSSKPNIASCSPTSFPEFSASSPINYTSSFDVTGNYLGYSDIDVYLKCSDSSSDYEEKSESRLSVKVERPQRLVDTIFHISVGVLCSIIFINFGCALDLNTIRESIKKPVGLAIGLISQIIFMPLIGYGLARTIFADSIPMQLGLYFTGISPSGGASNIWIYILGGNLNLSVTITAISNFVACLSIPFWTVTLGRMIFDSGHLAFPYDRIGSFSFALIPPLLIGLLMQKKCPRISKIMVKILKPFSSFLIVFIIVFATITNWYLFKLFTVEILIAGLCLPLFGYVISWVFALFFKLSFEDCLAVSIEAGVQNTGIAIAMLKFTLEQPEADLTTVVPVSVALMTPLPILLLYFVRKRCYSPPVKQTTPPPLPANLTNGTNKDANVHYSVGSSSVLISRNDGFQFRKNEDEVC